MKYHVHFYVNGDAYDLDVPANKTMLDVLRDELCLSDGPKLSPLQQSFIKHGALQCGFCTPGFLMSATALLNENPHPTREEIIDSISGNLCRCTGYKRIVEAIEEIAARGQAADTQE